MKHSRVIFGILSIFVTSVLTQPVALAMTDPLFMSRNDILFFNDECQASDGVGAVLLAGSDNLEKILNFFMQKGLTLAQAAGIVGNMTQESQLNPRASQAGGEASGPTPGVGFGLVQWTPASRQQALVAHAEKIGMPVDGIEAQLSFVWEELNGPYLSTLNNLRSVDDPVEAAVMVHGKTPKTSSDRRFANAPSPGYEASNDTADGVVTVRGGNAQKVFDRYKDGPALSGETAEGEFKNPTGLDQHVKPGGTKEPKPDTNGAKNCTDEGFTGGNFNETLKAYAWDTYKGNTIEARPEYTEATARSSRDGFYVGGLSHPGIDCGGFITQLVRDSGYDKGYNYDGKGGPTSSQEAWMKEHWEPLGNRVDEATLQPGDVAINSGQTFIYVGEVEGFQAKIASASLDERAPMADTQQSATDSSYNWYRKK